MQGDAPYPGGYTTRQVSRLLGIPDYAVRGYIYSGLISPRRGDRSEYRYSFQDLVVMRTTLELCRELSARRVFRDLRRLKRKLPEGRSLSTLQITVDGDALVVLREGRPYDSEGQRVFEFEAEAPSSNGSNGPRPLEAHPEKRRLKRIREADQWYRAGRELESEDRCEAGQAYMRALRLDPFHVKSHINLGRLRHESGALNEAVAHYRNALKSDPYDTTAAFNLGVALQDLDRPEEAIEAYRQVLAADPSCADAHYNLSRLAERLDRRKEALRHMTAYRNLIQ